jgi:WD40 repeat protein
LYSPDGKRILSTSGDHTIKEWDAGTGECVNTLAGHSEWVSMAVYNPDGEKILSTSDDKTIKEWDATTGECLRTLAGHTSFVNSAVYSLDGKKILSAPDDKTIKEWDAVTGQSMKTIAGHDGNVITAVYNQDGKKILSVSVKGTTIKKPEERASVIDRYWKEFLSTSYDYTVNEWDAATGECLKPHKEENNTLVHEYLPNKMNIELKTKGNKIFVPGAFGRIKKKTFLNIFGLRFNKGKKREFINIPGLFIQGCSFQNLEKGSQWSPEGLALLKQYNAKV